MHTISLQRPRHLKVSLNFDEYKVVYAALKCVSKRYQTVHRDNVECPQDVNRSLVQKFSRLLFLCRHDSSFFLHTWFTNIYFRRSSWGEMSVGFICRLNQSWRVRTVSVWHCTLNGKSQISRSSAVVGNMRSYILFCIKPRRERRMPSQINGGYRTENIVLFSSDPLTDMDFPLEGDSLLRHTGCPFITYTSSVIIASLL